MLLFLSVSFCSCAGPDLSTPEQIDQAYQDCWEWVKVHKDVCDIPYPTIFTVTYDELKVYMAEAGVEIHPLQKGFFRHSDLTLYVLDVEDDCFQESIAIHEMVHYVQLLCTGDTSEVEAYGMQACFVEGWCGKTLLDANSEPIEAYCGS